MSYIPQDFGLIAMDSKVTYYAGMDSDWVSYYIGIHGIHGNLYEIGVYFNGEHWQKDLTVFATKNANTFHIGSVVLSSGARVKAEDMEIAIKAFSSTISGQFNEDDIEVTDAHDFTLDVRKILGIHWPGCTIEFKAFDDNMLLPLLSKSRNAVARLESITK
jgi:hypothetical protein